MLLSPAGRPASARLYRLILIAFLDCCSHRVLIKEAKSTLSFRRNRKTSSNGAIESAAAGADWADIDDFCLPQRRLLHRMHKRQSDLGVAALTPPPSSRCSPNSSAAQSCNSSSSPPRQGHESATRLVKQRVSPRFAESLEEEKSSNERDEEAEEDGGSEEDSGMDVDVLNLRNALQARSMRTSKFQQMRSFNIDLQGRIVDCGFRNAGGKIFKPPNTTTTRRLF